MLSGSDLNRMLEAPLLIGNEDDSLHAVLQRYRDKAVLELLFSTGLRVSELAHIRMDDIALPKSRCTIEGKGIKQRTVVFSAQAKYAIKKYLSLRKDKNPYLFISHDKRTRNATQSKKEAYDFLTPRSIQRIVKKYAQIAGITTQVTPHTLRHSYATHVLKDGEDIQSVQAILGHISLTSTQVYIRNTHTKKLHKKQDRKIDKKRKKN